MLRLETKIRDLISKHDHLKHSHRQLNQGKMNLARDKEALMIKQQKAANQIEGLIAKLKSTGKMP